jgi:hypothetical protein
VNQQCQCKSGLSVCAGACVNRMTDNNHCGTCGNVCGRNRTCQMGICAT